MAVGWFTPGNLCREIRVLLSTCQPFPRNQRREYAEEEGNKQSLISSERKQEEMMPPRIDSESQLSPGTTPRLVQFVHHPFVSGLCPRAQARFAYWWRHFYHCLALKKKKLKKEAAVKWEQKRKGERRLREAKKNMGRKSVCDICPCKHCTPSMATHQVEKAIDHWKLK